jgi:hypothetical protein
MPSAHDRHEDAPLIAMVYMPGWHTVQFSSDDAAASVE